MDTLNPAAKPGHNLAPPYAQEVTERMALDYAELAEAANDAIRQADELPLTVENSEDVALVSAAVVKLRDISGRTESHRKSEKEPYLRSAEAVDAFFFRLKEQVDNVRKMLAARVDAFKQRQLAEERARLAAEAAEARRVQEQARLAQAEAEAAQRRARSAETARQREAEAAKARVDTQMAEVAMEKAELDTLASSSSLVRERFEGERSGLVGMRKKKIAMVTNVAELDLEKLRFFLKQEHLDQALRAWAIATDFNEQMPGAIISRTDVTVIK